MSLVFPRSFFPVIAVGVTFLLLEANFCASKTPPSPSAIEPPAHAETDPAFQQAKEAYAQRMAEIEQTVSAIVEQALREARLKADELKRMKSTAAREALLAAYEAAIARAIENADLDRATRLTAERQLLEGHGIPSAAPDPKLFVDNQLYACVLGVYGQFGRPGKYPVANLSVPNGDLWSEAIQSKLRARIDFSEINYEGSAKIVIPHDGTYTIQIPDGGPQFVLNGKSLSAGDVQLKKGVYAVRLMAGTHGQPFLPSFFVRVVPQGSDRQIPLVNSGADVKRFLSAEIDGQQITEISGYQPKAVDHASLLKTPQAPKQVTEK